MPKPFITVMSIHVIHILNHFLPQQTAGTEVYTYSLIQALRGFGIDGSVLIPHYDQAEDSQYVYDGITVHQFAQPEAPTREVILGLQPPSGVRAFGNMLHRLNPTLVHFHELAGSTGISVFHVQEAKRLGFKTVMTFHLASNTCQTGTMMFKRKQVCDGQINLKRCASCTLEYRGKSNWTPWLLPLSSGINQLSMSALSWNNKLGTTLGIVEQISSLRNRFNLLVSQLDHLVSLTHWYREVLLRNQVQANKITVVPQALALKPSVDQGTTERIGYSGDRPLRLLFLGRISRFKGLHTLIEAVLKLPSSTVELLIYGQSTDAEYESRLREQTAQMPHIRWMGTIPRDQVMSVFKQVDILCLCSTFSEMSPLVIQESFAAGVPVIATRVPGNIEQIQHERNGWLFPMQDADALTQCLRQLISQPQLVTAVKEQLSAPALFDEIAHKYVKLYERLIDQR
jgi:glycosyltransferase involved in cell wall biosynthesis